MAHPVREARTAAGLTQAELAARSGVTQSNIAAYERGTRQASPAMVRRLLNACRPRASLVLFRHRDAVLTVAGRNRAGHVRVFGSIARGEDTPDSDVDLVVDFEPGADLLDQANLVLELQDLLGIPVDVLAGRGAQAPAEAVAL